MIPSEQPPTSSRSPCRGDRPRHGARRLPLAGLLATLGCGDDLPALDDGTDASSTTAAALSSESDSSGPVVRQPLPPFSLPEGCGDGVVVPKQYDCFVPVSLDWLPEPWDNNVQFSPFDLDEDGRDEILLDGLELGALWWRDGAFELDRSVAPDDRVHDSYQLYDRWDWNNDGHRDLTYLGINAGSVHVRLWESPGKLGPVQVKLESNLDPTMLPHPFRGMVIPFDADLDGTLELFAVQVLSNPEDANPPEAFSVYREGPEGEWTAVGEAVPAEPCGGVESFAFGDFDGDGDEDVALLDRATVCNYPEEYDPQWYRVGVFLADPAAGTLTLSGWFPAGGTYGEFRTRLWADDLNGDGRVDLVLNVRVPAADTVCPYPPCTAATQSILRGRGDGTFEGGDVVPLPAGFDHAPTYTRGDMDGDGTLEWIVNVRRTQPWVLERQLDPFSPNPLPKLYDASRGGLAASTSSGNKNLQLPDVNGDGVSDPSFRAVFGGSNEVGADYWMVSAP